MKSTMAPLLVALVLLAGAGNSIHAQGTAFTYQGRLNTGGAAANGLYDFRFKLYADALGNTQVGGSYATNGIGVTNGLFVTTIDFGAGSFTGGTNWMEVDVKTNGAGSYALLTPLQGVTPTPNAIFAETADSVSGAVPATQLTGTVASTNLPSSPTVSGTVSAGAFAGNGANVTNVNAAALNGLNATNFWQVGGNAVAPGQFLGTVNAQPLNLEANGVIVQQLAYAADPVYGPAPNLIGGYSGNFASNGVVGGFIGGGGNLAWPNILGGNYSAIVGGNLNAANGESSTAMGTWSTANGDNSIAGGYHNTANGPGSVALGQGNLVGGAGSVALGWGNSTVVDGGVAIGAQNTVNGNDGFAFGVGNLANEVVSFALGYNAQSLHAGAFVWADDSGAGAFASTGANQFLIRAQGGVGINTNNPNGNALAVNGNVFVNGALTNTSLNVDPANQNLGNVYSNAFTFGLNSGEGIASKRSGVNIFDLEFYTGFGNRMEILNNGNVGIGTNNPQASLDIVSGYNPQLRLVQAANDYARIRFAATNLPTWDIAVGANVMNFFVSGIGNIMTLETNGNLYCAGTVYSKGVALTSDRNAKENFAPLNPETVLAKVAALPVTEWNYKTDDAAQKHIGPMAQDFQAAFQLSADDKHISVVDEGGVALAAIQGLNQRINEKDAKISELESRLNELEQTLQTLTRKK